MFEAERVGLGLGAGRQQQHAPLRLRQNRPIALLDEGEPVANARMAQGLDIVLRRVETEALVKSEERMNLEPGFAETLGSVENADHDRACLLSETGYKLAENPPRSKGVRADATLDQGSARHPRGRRRAWRGRRGRPHRRTRRRRRAGRAR